MSNNYFQFPLLYSALNNDYVGVHDRVVRILEEKITEFKFSTSNRTILKSCWNSRKNKAKTLFKMFVIDANAAFLQGIDSNPFFLVFYCDVSSRTMELHGKMHSSQTPAF